MCCFLSDPVMKFTRWKSLRSRTCLPLIILTYVTSLAAVLFIGLGYSESSSLNYHVQSQILVNKSISGLCRSGTWNRLGGMFDNSRQYIMYPHVIVGDKFFKLSSASMVTMATQTSFDRLFELHELANRWRSILSVAIFAADNEMELCIQYIECLQTCQPGLWSTVSFSFLVPTSTDSRNFDAVPSARSRVQCSCSALQLVHQQLQQLSSTRGEKSAPNTSLLYPQNHLRNLARKTCLTKYTYLVDVDTLPVNNMFRQLDDFLRQPDTASCTKCVFVVPAFEVDNQAPFPSSVERLVSLINDKKARSFHEAIFKYNQLATDSSRWLELAPKSDHTGPLYTIQYKNMYEPFYVAPDDVPAHDERFIGYGYTRNTQVYEMHVAGYRFVALAPLFSVHWGLKAPGSYKHWRLKQISDNSKRYATFQREIQARYAKNNRKATEKTAKNAKPRHI